MDFEEEKRLIALAQGGDETARNELVTRHLPFIKSRVSAYCSKRPWYHRDELLGLAVEGYFIAIRRFDPTRGLRLNTIAGYQILGRLADNARAEGKRIKRFMPLLFEEDHAGPPSKHEETAEFSTLIRAVSDLPTRMQQVVRMRFCQGMNVEDVGEAMGLSRSRGAQLVRECLSLLRKALRVDPPATKMGRPSVR